MCHGQNLVWFMAIPSSLGIRYNGENKVLIVDVNSSGM